MRTSPGMAMTANTGVFAGKREGARQATRTAPPDRRSAGATTSMATELARPLSSSVSASQPPWAKAVVGAMEGLRRPAASTKTSLSGPDAALPPPLKRCMRPPSLVPRTRGERACEPLGDRAQLPNLVRELASEMGTAMACRLLPPPWRELVCEELAQAALACCQSAQSLG